MKMEWNAGGWFGSQLGGSVWILVAALLSAIREPSTGLILLVIFAIPNIVGFLLWHRRTLSCYKATQFLVAMMGVSSLLAIFTLDRANLWRDIQTGGYVSVAAGYLIVVAVIILLMLVFYVRFGRNSEAQDD